MNHAKFEKLMSRAGELPTLPAVAHKVVEVIQDPRSSARGLRNIIELDPVISAKLLKLANSAYYRMAGNPEVADVHRAIVVLGFTSIRNIVLATCLRSLYSREFRAAHFSARDLWIHSVNVAVLSRAIAKRTIPAQAEELFMAGLVHDVGMIVEWNLFPDLFPQVLARYQGTGAEFTAAEEETLGFDHCAAGAHVLRQWQLPKPLRDVAAHHHKNERRHHAERRPTDEDALPDIVQLAERMCSARGDGFFDFIHEESTDLRATLEDIGLHEDDFHAIVDATDEELDRARDLLEL